MEMRRRFLAVVSATALVGGLGVAVTVSAAAAATSSAPGAGVTFSSQSGVANLVTHYVVTPGARGAAPAASTSSSEERAINFSPKGNPNPTNRTVSGGVTSSGSASETQVSAGTPAASASFIGQQASPATCSYFANGCNPPDMALGASSQFVLQGVNTQWQVLDTPGNVHPGSPVRASTFFGVPDATASNGALCDTAHNSQPSLSDPRALYDPIAGRFFAAMLQPENSLGIAPDCAFKSVYYVAVSQTSDPNGSWNVYEFDMSLGRNFGADYTQLGINGQAVYFSANMFSNTDNGFYAELFEANKAKMEGGKGSFTADGFFNLRANGPGITAATGPFLADTVNPAINLDASAGNTDTSANTLDGPDPVTGNYCGFTD